MAAISLFLILILAVSAVHKVLSRVRLAPVAARLAGAPASLGGALLALAASVEALAALALAIPATRAGGALAAALLWSAYALALGRRHGERLDCGCDFTAREKPVDAFAILRAALLAALALPLAYDPAAAVMAPDAPFAALALAALWFAAGELSVLPALARSRR